MRDFRVPSGQVFTALMAAMLLAFAANGEAPDEAPPSTVTIDDEIWTLAREAEHYQARVPAAIDRYWQAPLFREERKAQADLFLVNETPDCWVALYIEGITEPMALYRVSPDNVVVDARLFHYWLPRIRAYPDGPIHSD